MPRARQIINDIQTNYVYGAPPDPASAQPAVNALANELARVIQPIISGSAGPVPPMVVTPGFSGAKATGLAIRYLFDGPGNHRPGTEASTYGGTLSGALPYLESLGVRSNWVAFHLLNHRAGGLAVDTNLVPTPRDVNADYYSDFEAHMLTAYAAKPVEINVSIDYHSEDKRFVHRLSISGNTMKWQSQRWIPDNGPRSRLPSFKRTIALPVSSVIRINHLPADPAERAVLLRGSRLTEAMVNIVLTYVRGRIESPQDLLGILRNYLWTISRLNDPDRRRTMNDFESRVRATRIDYT